MAKPKVAKKATPLSSPDFPPSPELELLSSPTLATLDLPHALPLTRTSSSSGSIKNATKLSTPVGSLTHPSYQDAALDDMALELMVAKEAESEVDFLKKQVAQLQKEIAFKDKVILKLQSEVRAGSASASVLSITDASTGEKLSSSAPRQREIGLQCSVCVDYFTSPYTIECGHTFCYTCLHTWLSIHKSCPTCRTKLLRRPTLSFIIRDQVQAAVNRLEESERIATQAKITAEDRKLKALLNKGDVWENIFKPIHMEGLGNTILDADDGVRRCASCGWEVQGGACVNCSTLFSDVEDSEDSQDNSDQESEPDAYDSHDSFIDDDGDDDAAEGHIGASRYDGSDLEISGQSEDEESDPETGRRTRSSRTRRAKPSRARARLSSASRPVVVESDDSKSDSDDSEKPNDNGRDTEGDEEEKSEEEEVSLAQQSRRPRRQLQRRPLVISDDEDVDKVVIVAKPVAVGVKGKSRKRSVSLDDSSEDVISEISDAEVGDDSRSKIEDESGLGTDNENDRNDDEDDFVIESTKHKNKKAKKNKMEKDKKNKIKKHKRKGGMENLFV